MKDRRKGKVHPSLSSPSPKSSAQKDPDSLLQLLPVTVLALALSLPKPDREVLAYLIARSIIIVGQHPKTSKCKTPTATRSNKNSQKVPIFECGCFDCYTSFWLRWDSSPNRDLIHQVIESFEEHLVQNHSRKKQKNNRGEEREKVAMANKAGSALETAATERTENGETMPENAEGEDMEEGAALQCPVSNHKGLARKVLPDVVGLLNCRLWSLWSPGNI